jgi:PAS domain S-box-containing protein
LAKEISSDWGVTLRKRAEEILSENPPAVLSVASANVPELIHELKIRKIELELQTEELRRLRLKAEEHRPEGIALQESKEALKESEARYRSVVELARDGICIIQDMTVKYCNPWLAKTWGGTVGEVEGTPFINYVHPEALPAQIERYKRRMAGEPVPATYETALRLRDGRKIDVELNVGRLEYLGQEAEIVIVRDITERKKAANELELERKRLDTVTSNIGAGLALISRDFRTVWTNDLLKSIFGETTGEICYSTYNKQTAICPWCGVQRVFQDNEERVETESHGFDTNGKEVWSQIIATPVRNENGEILGALELVIPITERKAAEEERKRLEEQAQISSRLAAVGEMAAGVAHEINNPLTGILGYSQLLLQQEDIPADLKELLEVIAEGSQRIAVIVKRLLTFSRQTKPARVPVNMNEVIENSLKFRSYVFKSANIQVVTRFDPGLPWLVADPGQLQQVFLNLIVNAEQSMKEAKGNGTLIVVTENKGDNIRISFQDNGTGITKENMRHLFEPFFTTKPPGEGTGLGLSLSRSIILEHGGQIMVESEPGHGATFIIELPMNQAPLPEAAALPPVAGKKPAKAKQGKILVIDDEPVIRRLVKKILTPLGYTVDVSDDPGEFLDNLSAAAYDALLVDIRMPGISGVELYQRIREKAPAMTNKIVFITGDVIGPDIATFLLKNSLPYLAKPFDNLALEARVDAIIRSDQSENPTRVE